MQAQAVQKLGIDHLKVAVSAGGKIYDAIKKSQADGKLDFNDLGNFLPLVTMIKPLIDGGSYYIPEFKDLDSDEISVLMAVLAAENPELKGSAPLILRIKASLNLLKAGYEAYETFSGKKDGEVVVDGQLAAAGVAAPAAKVEDRGNSEA